jgi:CheY-like chemotaxis protein
MKSSLPASAKLLLVDDNPDGLLVRRALLEEQGFEVQLAPNAEEGLKLFKSHRFDVVVTDYRMPGMNGAQLIARMREIDPHVRVVLISSLVEPLGLSEDSTGADAVIAKNAKEPVHLLRSVRRLLALPSRKPPRSQTRSTGRRLVRA